MNNSTQQEIKFKPCIEYEIKIGFPHSHADTIEEIAKLYAMAGIDETRAMMLEHGWQFARDYNEFGEPLFFAPNFDPHPPLLPEEYKAALTNNGTMPKLSVEQAWKEACVARGLTPTTNPLRGYSLHLEAHLGDRKVFEELIGE